MRRKLAALGLALLVLPACEYTPAALGNWRDDPSCGRYENRNEPVSAEQERANRCLLDAFEAGRPAELIATLHGIDGGPVTTYYRVLGPHRVEVFVDETADVEGSQRWSHWLCDDLVNDSWFFSPENCRQLSVDEVVTAGYG